MAGTLPDADRVVVFDDDHYYMGGVLAELLARSGRDVTLVTPAACASSWTTTTMEQHRIQRRLLELDVEILASHAVLATAAGGVRAQCVFTGRETEIPAGAAVFVTARLPEDSLYQGLLERRGDWPGAGLKTVRAIGDCLAPGTIAAAVWEGHRYAQELEAAFDGGDTVPFRREVTELARD